MARKRQTHSKKKRGPNIRGRSGKDRGILRNAFWCKNVDEIDEQEDGGENEEDIELSNEELNIWNIIMNQMYEILTNIGINGNQEANDDQLIPLPPQPVDGEQQQQQQQQQDQQQQVNVGDSTPRCMFCYDYDYEDMPLEHVCNCTDGHHFECMCKQLTFVRNQNNVCGGCRQMFRHPNITYIQTNRFVQFIRATEEPTFMVFLSVAIMFCQLFTMWLSLSVYIVDPESDSWFNRNSPTQRHITNAGVSIITLCILNIIRNTETNQIIEIRDYNPETEEREPGFVYIFDRVAELRKKLDRARKELNDLDSRHQFVVNQLANEFGIHNHEDVNQQLLDGLSETDRHEVEVHLQELADISVSRENLLTKYPELQEIINQIQQQMEQQIEQQQQQQQEEQQQEDQEEQDDQYLKEFEW